MEELKGKGSTAKMHKALLIKLLGGKCVKCGVDNAEILKIHIASEQLYCSNCYYLKKVQAEEEARNAEIKERHLAMAKAKGWGV